MESTNNVQTALLCMSLAVLPLGLVLGGCGTSNPSSTSDASSRSQVLELGRPSYSATFASLHPAELMLAVSSAEAVLDARVGPAEDSSVFVGPVESLATVVPDIADLVEGDVIVVARRGNFIDSAAHPPAGLPAPSGTVALSISDSDGHLFAFALQRDHATLDRLEAVFGASLSASSVRLP